MRTRNWYLGEAPTSSRECIPERDVEFGPHKGQRFGIGTHGGGDCEHGRLARTTPDAQQLSPPPGRSVQLRPPHIVRDLPAGGRRLIQEAQGYIATVQTGAVTFEHGEHSGALPGGVIRGQQKGPTAA